MSVKFVIINVERASYKHWAPFKIEQFDMQQKTLSNYAYNAYKLKMSFYEFQLHTYVIFNTGQKAK